jgi:glyoxylate/hydroxypyruvate reductase A
VSTLVVHAGDKTGLWIELFRKAAPELDVLAWDASFDPARIDYVVGSRPPENFFAPLARLRAVFGTGAGLERLIERPDLPRHVPIVKLSDAGMGEQMAEYALYGALHFQRGMNRYAVQQAAGEWRAHPPQLRADVRMGVLGLGAIGSVVAASLAAFGYLVSGWSRTQKSLSGVQCAAGLDALAPLLARTDVLVNVLPSTPETRALLNHERLASLRQGAFVVNCSRGDQLDADALLMLLDAGHLSGALLDVFAEEPLPAGNPLWKHPKVIVTPHVAAITLPEPSVDQIVANIRRLEAGRSMLGVIARDRAY